MTIEAPPFERPTVDEVAALLRARTKDLDGVEVGTFNDNTRPTGTEAESIIDMAMDEISGITGRHAGACSNLAHTMATIRAAMWIEVSYWPEQVPTGRSVYQALADQYAPMVESLRACVEGDVPGDGETKAGYRFGVLDVHGWTASPYYDAPEVPPPPPPEQAATS
jgi:hypothetical protein